MEWILKSLGPKALLALLPAMLISIGNYFKNKDADNVGSDDAFGNVLIALAPAVDAMVSTQEGQSRENALKKALKGVYLTLGNYLGYRPPFESLTGADHVPRM